MSWKPTARRHTAAFKELAEEWMSWNPKGENETDAEYRDRIGNTVHAYLIGIERSVEQATAVQRPPASSSSSQAPPSEPVPTAPPPPSPLSQPPAPQPPSTVPRREPNLWFVFMYRWHRTIPRFTGETHFQFRERAARRMRAMSAGLTPGQLVQWARELNAWMEEHEAARARDAWNARLERESRGSL